MEISFAGQEDQYNDDPGQFHNKSQGLDPEKNEEDDEEGDLNPDEDGIDQDILFDEDDDDLDPED
ncbi:MAG: hypothetical protein EOO88_24675 [Pedobacter sp.]|nr:MAG: hypothetical protein EOO88_24675 [Pedobacter sp.]